MNTAATSNRCRPDGGQGSRGGRGFVLLMVIGLLVIIVMLGAAFLIISRLDAKQSVAISDRSQVDPIVGGVVARLQADLAADLHANGSGPYGGSGNDFTGWLGYIDYPNLDPNADPNIYPYDRLLFSEDPNNPARTDLGSADPNIAWDTDGDGTNDATVYTTGLSTTNGDEISYAVRMRDTSALINLNTAGACEAADIAWPISVANVNLKGMVGAGRYGFIHGARSNASIDVPTLAARARHAAVDMTNNDYLPFAIGDEVYLRNLDSGRPLPYGRLSDPNIIPVINSVPDPNLARLLTTFNCTRSIPRRPLGDFKTRAMLWSKSSGLGLPIGPYAKDPNDPSTHSLENPAVRKTLMDQIYLANGGNALQAAHLVANLWAATAAKEWAIPADPTKGLKYTTDFAITPTDVPALTVSVYGVVEQLVISEAYAYQHVDGPSSPANDGYAYAVELLNPTADPIDASVYQVQMGDDAPVDFPAVVVPSGGWITLYAKGGRMITGQDPADCFPDIASMHEVTALKDFNTKKIQILRKAGASGTVLIPVDAVDNADIKFTPLDPVANPTVSDAVVAFGSRNDDPDLQRFLVAAYEPVSGDHDDRKNHTLTKANALTADKPAGIWGGFKIDLPHLPMRSLGDLNLIHITGPEVETVAASAPAVTKYTALPQQLVNFKDKMSRGRVDFKDATLATAAFPDIPWTAVLPELVEVLWPDEKRVYGMAVPDRIYGRINVNTASREVLKALPWPTTVTVDGKTLNIIADTAVDYIIAYRDRTQIGSSPSYADRAAATNINVANNELRKTSPVNGILSPGEVSIPLAGYMESLMTAAGVAADSAGYLDARDALYKAVGNMVSVNSDTFVATILVRATKPGDYNNPSAVKGQWRFIVVIDRSNVTSPSHQPAVLLLTEVK